MSDRIANITIPVDLTNPGQFFACCGLLELSDRLWPGAKGWFASPVEFALDNGGKSSSIEPLCKAIIESGLSPLLSKPELDELTRLNRRKADLKRAKKPMPKTEEKERRRLNSKRIASGFILSTPFEIRIDWWLVENCDGDHLKTWAGPQAIASIANAIRTSLVSVHKDGLLDHESLIIRDGEAIAPLSFDSGRVGTALDVGYSSDKIGQSISCCVWTEFLTLGLPSIGHAHTDPSIRRVMIVAPLGDDPLLSHLARRLAGERLKPTPQTMLEHPPTLARVQNDNVARFYTKPANHWASVTPVILPGHDDHKPDKTRKLIEKALQQCGIEQECEFEWSAFSYFPKSLSAHKYDRQKRPTGYIRPDHLLNLTAIHLKLRFNDGLKVPGPLSIGSGRHCGLGLMAGIDS